MEEPSYFIEFLNAVDWATALISSSMAVAIVGILWRTVAAKYLASRIQHGFDKELETIRANHRQSEEFYRSKIRENENQLAALREGALSGMANRNSLLLKRRLEASDAVWSAIAAFHPHKFAMQFMSYLKLDVLVEEIKSDPDARKMWDTKSSSFHNEIAGQSTVEVHRPYVTPVMWGIYKAYGAIVTHSVLVRHLITAGLDLHKPADGDSVDCLIISVLPHQEEYVTKHGDRAYFFLLDELENLFLAEMEKIFSGVENDKATITQAGSLIKYVEQIGELAKTLENVPEALKQPPPPRPYLNQ